MHAEPHGHSVSAPPAPRLSVVVPSYNSRHVIANCLRSLEPRAADPDVEFIVVDSSDDGTDALIREQFPFVRLHHCPQRTYPGPARNLGAGLARGAVLAFTDADCVADPGWIPAVLDVFDRHPEVAACVGRAANHNPGSLVGWVSFLTEFNAYIGRLRRRPLRAWPTFNAAIRRDVFQRLGGFPPDVAWLEDMIFCAKLLDAGERITLEPTLLVYHHNRSGLGAFLHHQRRLGQFFAHSRFQCGLPGAKALRRSAFAIPALAAWRGLRAFQRTLISAPAAFLLLVLLSPLYLAGAVAWSLGVRTGRRECLAAAGTTPESAS